MSDQKRSYSGRRELSLGQRESREGSELAHLPALSFLCGLAIVVASLETLGPHRSAASVGRCTPECQDPAH